jgi:hypothetical protein|nr:MAG TPA: hypothetical protein [Caudoviricetes sp.]
MSDVFELSASDVTQSEKFRFKLPGEKKVYEVPNLNRLPIGVRMGLSEAARPLAEAQKRKREPRPEDVVAAAEAQMKLLDRYCPGILDKIDETQAGELMKAWADHSGISAGE